MTDIDSVTAMNLAEGRDIIDITVESIAMTMDVSEDVRFGRFAKPSTWSRQRERLSEASDHREASS